MSHTQGVWDRVQGVAGTTYANDAQVVVYGANQILDFVGGDDDSATLASTNGGWDSVYGAAKALTIDLAQANIYGEIQNLYLNDAGTQISLYVNSNIASPQFTHFDVWGSNATVINNAVNSFSLIGGGDRLYLEPSSSSNLTLAGTEGNWDLVFAEAGAGASISVDGAQASIFGDASISLQGGASAVSLYQTGSQMDVVSGAGAVTLVNAEVNSPYGYEGVEHFYFGGASNTLDLNQYSFDDVIHSVAHDVLTFAGAFGLDTIKGLVATDTIQLSKSQFADFQAFQNAFTQHGDDAVLTLDANDKVTFVGLQVSGVAGSQVKFV